MPFIHLVLFCYVLLYFILAGQAIFYKFCFTEVFTKISGQQFIVVRKLADPILQTRLAVVYYSSLGFGIILLAASVITASRSLILFVLVSFLLLVIDIILAKKYNIPLNNQVRGLINPGETLAAQIQYNWIRWIDIRANFILAGFFVLMIYLVFF